MTCADCGKKGWASHLTSSDFRLMNLVPETMVVPTELHTAVANGEAHKDTLIVFLTLWRWMGPSGLSNPTYDEIAGASGMSKGHATKIVAELVDLGFVLKSQRRLRTGKLSNHYRLSFCGNTGQWD